MHAAMDTEKGEGLSALQEHQALSCKKLLSQLLRLIYLSGYKNAANIVAKW